ncbi:hypothetical protein [Daejeonella oryzae]|uniref:hypothetical protein n=1 Tax=Daejeonella oryzae TaxID=1122943 RepID=UPI0003F4C42E|nr:hypothetical protein [Daejeonella oryzae]
MKRKSEFKTLFTILSIVLFFLTLSFELFAQEQKSTDFKDFKIRIVKTESGIKMESLKGSAWINLSFNSVNDKPQAIDEYGMTKPDHPSSAKDSNLADFLFTITKTKEGIVLKGFEGTAWTQLSFSLSGNEKQTINQFGMTY